MNRPLVTTSRRTLLYFIVGLAMLVEAVAASGLPPDKINWTQKTYSGTAPPPFGELSVRMTIDADAVVELTFTVSGKKLEVPAELLAGLDAPGEIQASVPRADKPKSISAVFSFGTPYRVEFADEDADVTVQVFRDIAVFTISPALEISKSITSFRNSGLSRGD